MAAWNHYSPSVKAKADAGSAVPPHYWATPADRKEAYARHGAAVAEGRSQLARFQARGCNERAIRSAQNYIEAHRTSLARLEALMSPAELAEVCGARASADTEPAAPSAAAASVRPTTAGDVHARIREACAADAPAGSGDGGDGGGKSDRALWARVTARMNAENGFEDQSPTKEETSNADR